MGKKLDEVYQALLEQLQPNDLVIPGQRVTDHGRLVERSLRQADRQGRRRKGETGDGAQCRDNVIGSHGRGCLPDDHVDSELRGRGQIARREAVIQDERGVAEQRAVLDRRHISVGGALDEGLAGVPVLPQVQLEPLPRIRCARAACEAQRGSARSLAYRGGIPVLSRVGAWARRAAAARQAGACAQRGWRLFRVYGKVISPYLAGFFVFANSFDLQSGARTTGILS